jgi:hypothetical protein
MNVKPLLLPLIEQLETLSHRINESPYISREGRLAISKDLNFLSLQLKEGEISYVQGETALLTLEKTAAADEISTLATKIRQLNPSSPRLENLRVLGTQLQSKEISPEQARKKIQDLMSAFN